MTYPLRFVVAAAMWVIACGVPSYDPFATLEERREVIGRVAQDDSVEAQRALARIVIVETDEDLRCEAVVALTINAEKVTEHPVDELKAALDAIVRDAKEGTPGPWLFGESPLWCVRVRLYQMFRRLRGPGTTELIASYLLFEDLDRGEHVRLMAAVGLEREEHRAAALPLVQRLVTSMEGAPRIRRTLLHLCGTLERYLDVAPATSPCGAVDDEGRWWAKARYEGTTTGTEPPARRPGGGGILPHPRDDGGAEGPP